MPFYSQLVWIIVLIKQLEAYNNDLNSELFNAVKERSLEQIKDLLHRVADPNLLKESAILMFAARYSDSLEMIQFLLDSGANVKLRNKVGQTVLHYAMIGTGNRQILNLLLKNGADINAVDDSLHTPLHNAAAFGNIGTVKWCMEKGGNLTAVDGSKKTPIDVIKNPDAQEKREFLTTAMLFLAETSQSTPPVLIETPIPTKGIQITERPTVRPFINQKAVFDTAATKDLIEAVKTGSLESVKELICRGADPNGRSIYGQSVLMYASESTNNPEVVQFLLQSGADVKATANNGLTALHYAIKGKDNLDIFELLYSYGPDIEAKSIWFQTPLLYATFFGSVEDIKWLVEKGANMQARDYFDRTPLDVAIYLDSIEKMAYLREALRLEAEKNQMASNISTQIPPLTGVSQLSNSCTTCTYSCPICNCNQTIPNQENLSDLCLDCNETTFRLPALYSSLNFTPSSFTPLVPLLSVLVIVLSVYAVLATVLICRNNVRFFLDQ